MAPLPTPVQIKSDYLLTFTGVDGAAAIFKVVEDISSRGMQPNSNVVYDVFLDPPSDTPWIDDIHYLEREAWADSTLSEELIIAINVYDTAGWIHMGDQVVKKWPPTCVRSRPNAFRVTIEYGPLFFVNFQISPQKTKRKVALDTVAWSNNDGTFQPIDMNAVTKEQYIAYNNINVDRKGIVQGVDVFDPSFTWTERWTYGPTKTLVESENKKYSEFMTEVCGTVNKSEFRGFPAQSVLFVSGVGRNVSPLTWEYDYSFSYKPKREYVNIGDGSSGLSIHPTFHSGHVHVDIEEQEYKEGKTQGDIITVPKVIKLHKIYPDGDFDILSVAPKVPFGYGTPFDSVYDLRSRFVKLGEIPNIGERWKPPEWALPDFDMPR